MARYKKSLSRRMRETADDIAWWWEKNKEGVLTGFMFGCVMVIIAAQWVLGLTSWNR